MTAIIIRRLAAVDIAFLGPRIVLTEFALGVVGPLALGVLTLLRARSALVMLFGLYLVTLGVNYVPLLVHAVGLVRQGTARAEIADEAGDQRALFRKHRRQSLWLLLPLVVPGVAVAQQWRAVRPR